jgi:hypothetical protein
MMQAAVQKRERRVWDGHGEQWAELLRELLKRKVTSCGVAGMQTPGLRRCRQVQAEGARPRDAVRARCRTGRWRRVCTRPCVPVTVTSAHLHLSHLHLKARLHLSNAGLPDASNDRGIMTPSWYHVTACQRTEHRSVCRAVLFMLPRSGTHKWKTGS